MPVTENFHSSDVHSGFLGEIPVHPIFWVTALRAPSSSIDWITLNSHPCCDFHPCADMEDSFTSGLHERFAICRTSPHFNRLGFRIHCFLRLKKKLLKRILFAAMTTWPTRSGMLSNCHGEICRGDMDCRRDPGCSETSHKTITQESALKHLWNSIAWNHSTTTVLYRFKANS